VDVVGRQATVVSGWVRYLLPEGEPRPGWSLQPLARKRAKRRHRQEAYQRWRAWSRVRRVRVASMINPLPCLPILIVRARSRGGGQQADDRLSMTAEVRGYALPKIKSTARHPLTWGPGPRR
jgi:hypothetical protein